MTKKKKLEGEYTITQAVAITELKRHQYAILQRLKPIGQAIARPL